LSERKLTGFSNRRQASTLTGVTITRIKYQEIDYQGQGHDQGHTKTHEDRGPQRHP